MMKMLRMFMTIFMFVMLFAIQKSTLAQNGIDDAKYYSKSWAVVIGINRFRCRQACLLHY